MHSGNGVPVDRVQAHAWKRMKVIFIYMSIFMQKHSGLECIATISDKKSLGHPSLFINKGRHTPGDMLEGQVP